MTLKVPKFEYYNYYKSIFRYDNYIDEYEEEFLGNFNANFYNISKNNRMYLDFNATFDNEGTEVSLKGKHYQDFDVLDAIYDAFELDDIDNIDFNNLLNSIDFDDINAFLVKFEDILLLYKGDDYLGIKLEVNKELLYKYKDEFDEDYPFEYDDIERINIFIVAVLSKDGVLIDIKTDVKIDSTKLKLDLKFNCLISSVNNMPTFPDFKDYNRKNFNDIFDSLGF